MAKPILTLSVVVVAGLSAVPAHAYCSLPSRWGGLEEQLYNQCQEQERTNQLLEDQQREQRDEYFTRCMKGETDYCYR